MRERVSRIMCQFCRGGGVVWTPRMAVQWGNPETFSLAAPSRCPECRGGGWFEIVHQPAVVVEDHAGTVTKDSPEDR